MLKLLLGKRDMMLFSLLNLITIGLFRTTEIPSLHNVRKRSCLVSGHSDTTMHMPIFWSDFQCQIPFYNACGRCFLLSAPNAPSMRPKCETSDIEEKLKY